jgi:hypothetical protein
MSYRPIPGLRSGLLCILFFPPALWGLPRQVVDVRQAPYGAKCDWDGKQGTDDTAAFAAAAAAASAKYRETGRPVDVRLGASCELTSTVTFGSGVHWVGPGTVYVPNQRKQIFQAQNADEVSVEGITIEVLAESCGSNNASCSAISWESTRSDAQAHTHVSVRNNIIHRSNWGILVGYAAGSGSLSEVEIEGNIISSPAPYGDADGIHVGGRVSHFSIRNNRIFNRGDAGVAASSEVPNYICSGGVIEDNVLIEDQVGLDNSGCTNTLWKGNFVRATLAPRGSNPAFRSITYLGLTSANVTVMGNYFQNGAGFGEYAAKVDEIAGRSHANAFFWGNTVASPLALYLRGSLMEVAGNLFTGDNATLTVDYDGPHTIATDSISIGSNRWRGSGTIRSGDNPGLVRSLSLKPQSVTVPLTYQGGVVRGIMPKQEAGSRSSAILRGQTSAIAARPLAAGDCFSSPAQVRGAVPTMSALVTSSGRLPESLIAWAFVNSPGVVVVRTCAVQQGTLPATAFSVAVQ